MSGTQMSVRIVDGRALAQTLQKKVAQEVAILRKSSGITPNIVTVKVGTDPSSDLYLKLRDKACSVVGIHSTHCELPETVSENKLIRTIRDLNDDTNVHGILVQFPLPRSISIDTIMESITPIKDVEGFHPINMGRTVLGDESLVPCTPRSVLTILNHEKVKLQGKDVVIVNHSTVVGKPLTALLLNRNATVAICHVFTHDLLTYTQKADIIISAAGVPRLITDKHIAQGAIVIDVGITPTKTGVCGDVDFDSVKNKASILTPVPGGVGPVTIACSLQNMLKTFRLCIRNIQ